MLRRPLRFLYALGMLAFGGTAAAQPVQDLGAEFWAWRAKTQPATSDDIPRIVRPAKWVPDWSPKAIEDRKARLADFERRFQALADTPQDVSGRVDYRLVGSALARVRWEMDHVAAWQRQPQFYVDQALVPIFETLLPPPPVKSARVETVIALVERIPATLLAGQSNLTDMRGPFVEVAIAGLERIPASLNGMADGLRPSLAGNQERRLRAAIQRALTAFESYGAFLAARQAGLSQETAVGRDGYTFFLRNVALYPYTPEQLLIMGRQEWTRSVQFEELERNRNRTVPQLPIGPSIDAVVGRLNAQELEVRTYLRDHDLLTVPDWAGHYNAMGFPAYLAPIGWLGRTFDLTDRVRVGQNATVYLPEPSPSLGYFNLSITRDPRPIIVHEGVPGHFFQLTLSWRHPNPLRRYYYDSAANEGTGFYAEEMMLQAGLFDDSPRTREIIYNFARLRALRVEVDVKLALGEFTIAEAADCLAAAVPMDRETAEEEAVFFAASPGQAISYQIGKLQTLDFLTEAKTRLGDRFSLKHFHDYLWLNGNVPIALQREEYLATAGKGAE
ncbi:DUF885 family protein [Allosphingosinicella indica]|uniref:Uncharacterized conserved protein, DUF885 familyt n=1 Tax=Allosphingosinicella indica TaxID=941907 RepID=A0A1X7GCN6_9SPHN|nr:DUF885 family protein [Allosphingosinicella indica]SMF67683.1 Uncharacterized conserved protein, DUF885 familyt [Allosphingosinicella indica]